MRAIQRDVGIGARIVAAVAMAMIAGCTTTQVLSGADPNRLLSAIQIGDTVRAVTSRGETPEFEIVAIEDGGLLRGSTTQGEMIEVALGEISELYHRRVAAGKTAVLVALLTGVLAVATTTCEEPPGLLPGLLGSS